MKGIFRNYFSYSGETVTDAMFVIVVVWITPRCTAIEKGSDINTDTSA